LSGTSPNRLFGTVLAAAVGGLLILASATTPAFAYLDPGAGSMLLQATLAVVAGSLFALKQYWGRMVSFLRRKPRRDQTTDDITG
jgi:uncharacterized integral membrane protein